MYAYSVSINFRLECLGLIEPSAKEIKGQQYFSSNAVSSLAKINKDEIIS